MKPGWLILLALAMGLNLGFMWAGHTADVRYLRALAEKHEAIARYWDTKADDIISNNTLNRRKQ
jgi:hypothetical protein